MIYFLRAVGHGPIKIGHSRDPEKRRRHYSMWTPYPLEIVATFPGDRGMESRFHLKFALLHSHHEWFHDAPELLACIDRINAGEFTMDELPTGPSRLRSETALQMWARRRARAQAAASEAA